MRLKASKCQFFKQEIPFVGRLISQKGMRSIPEYVEGFKCIKPPETDKEKIGRLVWLKSFIGTRLDENVLKERMTKCPYMSFCDPRAPYILTTDASDCVLGDLLMQKVGPDYRVIAAVSKCFSETEWSWSATKREAFAVL